MPRCGEVLGEDSGARCPAASYCGSPGEEVWAFEAWEGPHKYALTRLREGEVSDSAVTTVRASVPFGFWALFEGTISAAPNYAESLPVSSKVLGCQRSPNQPSTIRLLPGRPTGQVSEKGRQTPARGGKDRFPLVLWPQGEPELQGSSGEPGQRDR